MNTWGATAHNIAVGVPERPILQGVSASVAYGELVALVGSNGAGKSTLLRTLSGEIRSSSGTVALHGRDLRAWPSAELARRRVMLSQHSNLAFDLPVRQVVRLGRAPWENTMRAVGHAARVDECLDRVGLLSFADRRYQTLSGGEKQRVQLARVLAQMPMAGESPALVLADEPGSAQDPGYSRAMMAILRDLASDGHAVMVAMHDLVAAARVATRVIVMHRGQVVAQGTPQAALTPETLRYVFGIDAEWVEVTRNQETHSLLLIHEREATFAVAP
jgi:iron complex transport system ATP-binding protein